jgi:AcrR family transcriptional regulator
MIKNNFFIVKSVKKTIKTMETFKPKFVSCVSLSYICNEFKMTAELKESILLKTENLFLKFGIKSVTMDDIARELGISKKTLYQFFENKTDLLQQMTGQHIAKEVEAMTAIQAKSKNALEECCSTCYARNQPFRIAEYHF